jgi:hypothetical protein
MNGLLNILLDSSTLTSHRALAKFPAWLVIVSLNLFLIVIAGKTKAGATSLLRQPLRHW